MRTCAVPVSCVSQASGSARGIPGFDISYRLEVIERIGRLISLHPDPPHEPERGALLRQSAHNRYAEQCSELRSRVQCADLSENSHPEPFHEPATKEWRQGNTKFRCPQSHVVFEVVPGHDSRPSLEVETPHEPGRNGALRRPRRVQRRKCSARCTRAGTSQRDVPANVRLVESLHFQNRTRIGTMNRGIGARTAESARTSREGTPGLSGPRSEFRFMERAGARGSDRKQLSSRTD